MKLEAPPTAGCRKTDWASGQGLATGIAILAFVGSLAAPAAGDPLGAPIFVGNFESGTICAWSTSAGWTGAPCVALQIDVTEGGGPLVDGALFNRDVVPVLDTTGGTAPITLEATLDGAPFTSGSIVTGDGLHVLQANAEDADGLTAEIAVAFSIDTLGPVFVSVSPPEGFVTSSSAVVLSGEVSGATTLTVNGAPVVIANGLFTSEPLPLAEGAQSFLLVATDLAGNSTPLARSIVRDSLSPGVTISQPAPGVVGSSPITVAGTATDPHLAQVLVNGQAAAVAGATYSLTGLALVEGANEIVVEAFDAVGNPPGTASVAVTLDSQDPVIAFLESGLPLADGALFNRTVTPIVVATDATKVNLSVTLNGEPFASGTPVADEGGYTLQATAVDEGGNSANLAASFVLDMTAPTFVTVLPPDNTLVAAPEIALSGEVAGAQSVTVDGLACTLTVEAFACPSFSLTDGERIFTLLARDAAGNEAPRQHRIRRDGTGPEVVIATPVAGAYLASANVAVNGTAVDPHLAEVRVNGVLAALAGDAWSAGPISLAEGAATIEVIARDTVDNATVVSRSVTIDTVAPEVELLESGTPLGDGALFNRTVTPVIEVTDASPWTLVATLDGAAYVSGTPVASEGLHVLQATATDSAGNPGTRQVSFRVDGSPPALVAISPVDGFVTAEAEVHLQGQILGAETLTIDGVDVTLLGDQFIAGPYSLAEGERTFAIVALDAAANELSLAHHVVRDITAPTVAIQLPAASALFGTSAVQVTGQAADLHLVSVAVNGVAASLSGSTWVAPQVPLGEGESTLVATAVDRAGNSAAASRVVVRDSQAPMLTITDPATGSVVPDAEVMVSGSVDEPNLDRVTVQGVTAVVAGGSFSATVALVEGDNTLVARATDRLGHAAEATRLVRRDATAPGLEITAPDEGSRIAAVSIAVSGTIAEETGVALTVNGVAATIAGGSFAAAAVPLVEGENRLIARARDANGNEGARTRTVVRDTVAPTILGTEPPTGALAIALSTVFIAELSEVPGPASVAGMHLETGAGAALAATVEIFASELRLVPSAALPSSGLVRLVLDQSIVDLAGNGLAVGATFEFTTADATAPAAPTIPAPPARFLCADEVTLAGFAEPDRWVEVAGGAGAVRARAASDGAWSVAVPLIPGAIQRLAVTSVDDAGNRSPATEIEVVHDCAEPIVERVDASASGFAIQFSEEIEPASFAGSILVSGAAGAIDGSVALDVDRATFTAAAALPEGAIRVEVLRQPRDLAGNLLAYPWVSVFGGDAAESFFVATAIDDAVGRPLAGARARVLATNGVPPSGTALESTSAGDGAVSVPVPVGTHLVAFERPDSTPVFRFVTTQAQLGTDVVDPRLTPLSAEVAVGPEGGTVAAAPALAGPAAELQLPAGALASSTAISLTELSEQGLPRLLPFGWSPRAAVWIAPEGAELLLPATLTLPVDAVPGSTVAWVHLNPETRVWRVEGVTALGVAELELPVAEAGAWAVVEADPPPFAVPAAVVGEPLGSLPAPPAPGETLLGATLAFDPETVLPGQRSRATVDYTATEAAASGSTVTLSIAEELQLLDGSTRTAPPYRADLVVYRTTEGARSRFFLASSEAARLLPIELGEENVAVLPYGGETVRGNVVGPQGGSVLDPSGDRIDIPVGALVRPTPVQLEPAAEGTLPLPVPEGFAFAGALRLDLSGETLLMPATLFLASAETPPAGEAGILFGVESPAGGDYAWRPLATISPSGSGWLSDGIDLGEPMALAWPGATHGGTYLFARALTPLGFVRGTVFDVGGATLANAVIASTGATAVEWLQLSGSDGRYAYPAWVGAVALTATKPSTGDQGSGSALLVAAGERVDLDLALVLVRPSVVSTTPTSGATGVPVGIEPIVQFSEPVERSSLAAAITLRPVGGAPVAFDIHHLGSQVTLEPAASLEPEAIYELVIGEGVRDLQGHAMAAPVTVSFTTQSVTLPSTVDLTRVLLYAPGTNGESRIQGLAGAAPAGTLVFVENLTRLAAAVSVAAEQDGSFELSIVAQVTDRLLLHVLIAGANEVVAILGPFRTADGRGAYVGAEGSTFTTIDGWTFSVPADTFDETSVVHVVPRAVGQLPASLPASFVEGVSFALDFGGATPEKAIELALPAPAGAPAGRPILVLREMRAAGVHGWMLHELAIQEGGRLVTLAPGAAPFSAELFAEAAGNMRGETSSGPSLGELAAAAPGAMLPGMAFAGNYTISWTPEPLGFLGFPTTFWNDAYVETALTGIVTVLNRAIESLLEHDAVLIPTLLGAPVAVTVHDAASGFVLYEGDFLPPPGDGGIAEIPPATFGDTTAPHPVAGAPLRLFVLDAAEAAGGELDHGVSFLFAGDSVAITGASGSVSGEARVRLLGLDDARSSFTTAATDGAFELQATVAAGNRYLLALGARIDATAALEIAWSEPLGDGLGAIRVLDDVGRVIGADVDFGADRSVVVVTPRGGWPTDRDLRLELGDTIADPSGNRWEKTLELDFRARASQVVGHYPFEHVYDVARLGELLFLAAGQQGLAVLDASDPSELENVMPGGLTFPLPYSDIVRAVAVDPHGRVLVAGGGLANFGVLRVFDPLALPEILAAPDPAAARGLAWRGTTIVSDRLGGTGTQLPSGTPRKLALYSDDLASRWRVGEPAPDGLVATFTAGEAGALGTLALSGNGAAEGAPVSLRNLTRAGFARVDADGAGGFTVSIAASSSDRIELLRNRATIAYLATLGAGVEAVDVNAFYHGPDDPSPATSRVVGIYSGLGDSSLELCNESVPDLASALIGLDLLVEAAASPPIDIAALVGFRGLAEIESPPSAVGNLSFLADACAEVEGSRAVRALAAAVDFPWDLDADGHVDADERERDYAFVTHATGGLLAFDLTRRSEPQLVARVRLPLVVLGVAIDRTRMRAYVSGATGGLAIVDLAALATTTFVDSDENGVDDRVLEVVPIPEIQPGSPAVVLPDLGLVFVGGDGGAASIAVGAPAIVFVTADGSVLALSELAPLGVPSRSVGTVELPRELPASFRIRVALPGSLGPEVKLDVAGIGPGGEPIDDAGELLGLPRSRLEGEEGVVLHRLADSPWEEGVHWYESDELVAVADLRAAKEYTRTAREADAGVAGSCVRCDRVELEIPESAREILSGEAIRVSFPEAMIATLAGTYDADRLREAAATVASVRWETAPSLRQEPAQSPSLGSGDVVPGTLLHSGELSQGAVDLAVAGRGLDFAFARTYRSQTVGGGPLGPGWDFGYRMRLRKLPTGDIELYDGRGRRETFKLREDGTLRAPTGVFVDLQETSEGYLLLDPAHTLVRFDEWGRLISIADASKDRESRGNEMRFFYDARSRLRSVLDALGREYQLDYDDAGRLTTLTDFAEREVVYTYDTEGCLETVRSPLILTGEAAFPGGLTTTYEYATPEGELASKLASRDNLTSVTDPRGGPQDKPFEATYTDTDGDARAEEVTAERWGDQPLAIAYDFEEHSAAVTDRRGHLWSYQHGETGQVMRFEDPTTAPTLFEVDDEGLVKRVTKPLGGVTEITYDSEGSRRSRGNALVVAVTADDRGDNGSAHTLTTTYEYEGYSNQLTRITDPRGAVTQIVRNEVGLAKEITEALGEPEAGTTKFDYNDYGQPTKVTNPNLHVTTYAYFATGESKGYLQKRTVDPLGLALETVYDTDPRGKVKSVTDPRGVRHESTYNEVDWLVETKAAASAATDGSGAPALNLKTTFLHDENGNVVEERIPFGDDGSTFTRVERDHGVLNEVKQTRREIGAGDFAVTTLTYDESFNVATILEPEGQLSRLTHNSRNLLEAMDRGVDSPEAVQESYAYDAEGQRTTFTDGRTHSIVTSYDGFGRVAKGTDPLGNHSQQTYDNASNPLDLERFDALGTKLAASSGVFDLRGRRRELREKLWSGGEVGSARDLVTRIVFDALGNIREITDPKNRTSFSTYDAAERPASATDPAGNRSEWTLDRRGNPVVSRLTEQVSGGDSVTTAWTATYDALGRTLSVADPLGHSTTRTLDARGNPRLTIDPDGYLTESTFDGLDRVKRTVRPEGVAVDYGYDRSSRLTTYKDALNHQTSYQYDPLNRLKATIYPDLTQQTIGYDGSGNPNRIADANGNVSTQLFDDANRLQGRSIALGAGVEGPTSESFTYDGLSRLISAQSGLHTATRSYDSLSRLLSDGQNGRAVGYERDDAGNATQMTYPSGAEIVRGFDPLDRLQAASLGGEGLVSYGFRGPDLIASKQLGNGLAGTMVYDGARRLVESSLGNAESKTFEERITWNPRDLKASIERGDLNGELQRFHYDGAQRLTGILRDSLAPFAQPVLQQPVAAGGNAVLPFAGELPGQTSFTYDAAQALIARTETRFGVGTPIPSPSDLSGRNRPASVGGDTLAWDANGNLLSKGDKHYHWDFRNRLTRVTQDGAGEIARYEYDAFNRLQKRVAGSDSEELVWNGWQLIERHKNGVLESRRVYGAGLDEVVREERDNDGDGTLEAIQVPIYDSIGNPVAITGMSGIPIERRSFSAYGQPTFTVDPEHPEVEQLREADGTLLLEFSEEVLLERNQAGIVAGEITLTDTTDNAPIAITADQPIREGKQRGRRLILTPDPAHPPTVNHGMRLRIESETVVDLFENELESAYENTFVWLGANHVKEDTSAPRVELVTAKQGSFEIQFRETIDPVVANATILLDGQTIPWTAKDDGYTLAPTNAISATTHTLQIGPALIDLAGTSLVQPFSTSVTTGGADKIVYEAPNERVVASPPTGNLAGFQGHLMDPATGLVYARNRWIDPEVGRFISVDALGYTDGPSLYGFAENNPVNLTDALGLLAGEGELGPDERKKVAVATARHRETCAALPEQGACQGIYGQAADYLLGDEHPELVELGTSRKGKPRAVYVNGILTPKEIAVLVGESFSLQKERGVDVVWNPTAGKSVKGFFGDNLQALFVNKFGATDETTRLLVRHLRSRVAGLEPGETVPVYAHSQGGPIVSTATAHLSPAERSRIDLVTYAAASYTYPSGFHSSRHVVSAKDLVPDVVGKTIHYLFERDVQPIALPFLEHGALEYIKHDPGPLPEPSRVVPREPGPCVSLSSC